MKYKKIARYILWSLAIVFLIINTIAFFHAYKFTHFDSSKSKTKESAHFTVVQKLNIALFGIDNPRPENKKKPGTPFETIKLKSNKTIECWYMKANAAKGTVALFHGYGGEKSSMLDKAAIFQNLGYNVLLADFMGAGGSEGNQTTIGFKEAIEVKTCYDYLKQRGENNILLFGTSLGAAAVMKAMSDYDLEVSSIIIECPFGTMVQTVKNRFHSIGIPAFPMAYLLLFWGGVQNSFNAYKHNPEEYAYKIKCPTLLFYGAKDQKVTTAETQSIFKNLAGRKTLVTFPLAGHENYLNKYKAEWTQQIAHFLNLKQVETSPNAKGF